MNDQFLDIFAWIFAIVFTVYWFWTGPHAAMGIYIVAVAVAGTVVYMGGPQFMSGVVTGIVANDVTRRIRKL